MCENLEKRLQCPDKIKKFQMIKTKWFGSQGQLHETSCCAFGFELVFRSVIEEWG